MGIYFDENGATMDETITLDQLRTAIKALKHVVSKNAIKCDFNDQRNVGTYKHSKTN